MSTCQTRIVPPSPQIIKFEHGSAPKLISRICQVPNPCVIVNFNGSNAAQAPARFGSVSSYGSINQVIVPGDVPAAAIRINAIAFIAFSVTEGIVLYEQELLASEVSCICPGSVAMGVPPPSIVVHLKSKCPSPFVQNAMVDNPVNLAVRHDKRVGIQLIKMAVVDPRRWTCSHKVDASIVSKRCDRSISECKARQAKRLVGLESRYENSRHLTCLGDSCRVRFESRTCLAAQGRCARRNFRGLLRQPLLLLRGRMPLALARNIIENDGFVCYHRAT